MMKKTFQYYVDYCGIGNLPEGIEGYFEAYKEDGSRELLKRSFLDEILKRFEVPELHANKLHQALEEIEQDEDLFHFSKFLVKDMCSARNRIDADSYTAMNPSRLGASREFYSFLLLLSCVEPSMEMLRQRGVPGTYYENIPFMPMKNQFKKLVEKNDPVVSDFPWDMNFYTSSIFLLDRFFFIPFKYDEEITFYRNLNTAEAKALIGPHKMIRRDGEYNGVNGIIDEKESFETVWEEDEKSITAYPVSPMGYVEQKKETLKKEEWIPVLAKGDDLLALHIPSGPGYTPERLRNSMELAENFYSTYFPEIDYKGFGSESWLYDPHLSLILSEETSNIVKVQRQFYVYPIKEGDGMLCYEVFGNREADTKTITPVNSLQRKVLEYMEGGNRFNTHSMVVLKGDVEKIPEGPYIRKEHIAAYPKISDMSLKGAADGEIFH